MWVCLAEIMWYSGQPTTISVFSHVIFILCLLILGNLLVKRFRPAWALKPPELLVIYTMLCLASAMCGHDMGEILAALHEARRSDKPTLIIAYTIKGKDVSFMEGSLSFHGKPPSDEQYVKAMTELNQIEEELHD